MAFPFPFPRPRRAARGNRLGSGLRGAAARRRRPAAPAVAGALSLLAATLAVFAAAPANAATGAAEPVVSVSDLSEDYAAYLDGTYDGELAPSPLDLSYLADSLAAHSALRAAELPSSFDLRETNRIGGMLNQHETENCWAFAALSSAEASVAAYYPHTELSRSHLAWFTHTGNEQSEGYPTSGTLGPYQLGAFEQQPVATLAAWEGPIPADLGPFMADSYSESLRYLSSFHLADAFFLPSSMNGYYDRPLAPSIDTVKTILHDYGPATLSIATHTSSTHVTDDTFYTDSPDSIDHAVLIVGWDDDFARENFDDGSGVIPEADGAWLIKNSWGTEGTGDNGYYWVSYEDASAVYGACYQLESAENYDVNYQFDTLGWVTSLSVEDGTAPDAPSGGAGAVAYMANIFTAGADGTVSPDEDAAAEGDEELSAVSFYTTDENASYAVSVYRGPEAGDPASGTLVGTQEGFEEYPGYHTVELDESLRCRLAAGDTFSVVVRLQNPVYENPIPAEGTGLGGTVEPEYLGRNAAGELETSYVSADGETWGTLNELFQDSRGRHVYVSNVCLKAFTEKVEGVDDPWPPEEWPEACVGGMTPRFTYEASGDGSSFELTDTLDALSFEYDDEAGVWRATCAVPEHALESDAHPTIGMLVTGGRRLSAELVAAGATPAQSVSLACNTWSVVDRLDFTGSPITLLRITSSDEGKEDAVYEIAITAHAPTFDTAAETVSFDEGLYTVHAPDGTVLHDGDAVSAWSVPDTQDREFLEVTSISDGASFKAPVPYRHTDPTEADYTINYTDESLSMNGFSSAIVLREGREPQAAWGSFPITPGETIRLKKGAEASYFASAGSIEIALPTRPDTPPAPAVLDATPTSVTLERTTPENALLEFSRDGVAWSGAETVDGLEPGAGTRLFARVAAIRSGRNQGSFCSDPVTFTVATPALAEAFDLRDDGLVTPVRDQGPYELGWAFAALGSLESNVLKRAADGGTPLDAGALDLSEASLALLTYRRAETSADDPSAQDAYLADAASTVPPFGLDAGGTWQMAASTLARGQGAASEADVPLIVDEDAQAAGEQMAALAAAVANDDAVRLESVRALSSPIASYDGDPYLDEAACTAMKAAIAEDGALFANAARVEGDDGGWGIGTDGASHAVWRTDDAGRTSDHAVTIVGWDDTFSARNFAVACDPDEPHAVGLFATIDSPDGTMMVPTHDGAWIVRDSRGADMGDGGYYYVSCCDLSLRNPVSFRAEAPRPAAESTVRTSYQYDGLSAVDLPGNQAGGPVGSGRDTAAARSATDLDAQALCGANVFRARSAGSIDRIGTWATAPGRRIMVQVYTDLARADDPTSGTLAASKTKPVGQAGYYTLELPHAVGLSEGEAFSVVVCLQDAVIGSGDLSVPLEGGGAGVAGAVGEQAGARAARPVVAAGQSFICEDGVWTDVTLVREELADRAGTAVGNVAVKAFGTAVQDEDPGADDPGTKPDDPGTDAPGDGTTAGGDPDASRRQDGSLASTGDDSLLVVGGIGAVAVAILLVGIVLRMRDRR